MDRVGVEISGQEIQTGADDNLSDSGDWGSSFEKILILMQMKNLLGRLRGEEIIVTIEAEPSTMIQDPGNAGVL